jgi:glycosyltransferase involved in cell wall biosynthesis
MLGALGNVWRASAHLATHVMRHDVTHVFAVDFRAVLVHAPALAMCRLLGVPVLLRSGVAPTRTALHARLWQWLIQPLVTRHVANSAFTASELRAVGVDMARIVTIPNVAPRRHPASVPALRNRWRVAYVGQVIPEKGVRQLLDAIGLLAARGFDAHLDVAGQMEGWAPDAVRAYRESLRHRAAEADLAGRVRFLGWREDIESVLQQASVHCCPSQPEQREGFGITVVEAKRAGIPSVVCPSGALPELIQHRRDGWVTEGFDAMSVANGLEWLLSDDLRLQSAQQAALESAKQYDAHEFEGRWQAEFGLRAADQSPHVGDCALAGAEGGSR